jgi:hypothetical protein
MPAEDMRNSTIVDSKISRILAVNFKFADKFLIHFIGFIG